MQICIHQGNVFEYVKMPPLNQRLILLTHDNRYEFAAWKGAPPGLNKTYKAWHGAPARHAEIERQLGFK